MTRPIVDLARRRLIGEVRATFNDLERGEQPVQPSNDALFPPGSVIRRVHGDVTTMMVGGIAALLLQMLHPAVLAGVWDFSDFRHDMLGRLRRTARFIAQTTYGERSETMATIERVQRIHSKVVGTLSDGTPYRADDPASLAWVHACEALCFLDGWIAHGEPSMSSADQDRYFDEFALIAEALGADPVPRTRAEANLLIADMRPTLRFDDRTQEVARLVLKGQPTSFAVAPVQRLAMQAAVDLLPEWARRMHGLSGSGIARPLVAASTTGIAGTLRWAFRTR